jgi:putative endonuclease
MPLPMFLYRFLPFGRESEILGIDYLRSLGYRIVATGYRTQDGEVDIIAWDGDVLVFVEVKSLSSSGSPEDSVGPRKRERIIRAARTYIAKRRLHEKPCRFDILAVARTRDSEPDFRLLRDAFPMHQKNI